MWSNDKTCKSTCQITQFVMASPTVLVVIPIFGTAFTLSVFIIPKFVSQICARGSESRNVAPADISDVVYCCEKISLDKK